MSPGRGTAPPEFWDVLDEKGAHTGRTVARGYLFQHGEFHLAVHVWIRNQHGSYLIQERAPHVDSDPQIWATTVGHVLAGEASLSAALRETREELDLNLEPAHLRHIHRCTTGHLIQDVYLVVLPAGKVGALTLAPEVSKVSWASKAEIKPMIQTGLFFPYSYFADVVPA